MVVATLTSRQVASILGVSQSRVHQMVAKGQLEATKVLVKRPTDPVCKIKANKVYALRKRRTRAMERSEKKKKRFLSYPEIQRLTEKARRYRPDLFIGITHNQLYAWTTRGCRFLKGGILDSDVELRFVNGGVREVEVYHRGQILKIINRMLKEAAGEFMDEDGVWLSAKAAKRRPYEIWDASLRDWSDDEGDGCLYLRERRRLKKRVFRLQIKRGRWIEVTAFFKPDLDEIVGARNSRPDGVYHDGEGDFYYAEKTAGFLGVRADNLWHYRRKRYPYLPGDGRIYAKKIPGSAHARPQCQTRDRLGFFAPHILAIHAHQAGKPSAAPSPSELVPLRQAESATEASTCENSRQQRTRRRRKSQSKPLTSQQRAAFDLVLEHNCNVSAAAEASGQTRQVLDRHYKKACKKLGKRAVKNAIKTRRLPVDRRGQPTVKARDGAS